MRADDLVGLHNAVGNALTHPIDSYIPDNMKFDWVTNRMAEVVEGDWRGKGEEVLEQWKEEGKAVSWKYRGTDAQLTPTAVCHVGVFRSLACWTFLIICIFWGLRILANKKRL